MTGAPVVLLTRPGNNEELAAWLRESGADVRVCPAIRLAPLLNRGEIAAAWNQWRAVADNGLVVVTSVETVRLLVDAAVHIDRPVAAVGPATTAAVRDAGYPLLDIAAVDAESLGYALITNQDVAGRDVWLPQSARAESKLADALRAGGAAVAITHLYEPVAEIEALRAAVQPITVDVAAFYSGSAVRAFAQAIPGWSGGAVCIGSATAAAATAVGWARISVASAPTDQAVLDALLREAAPTGKAG